ncbi:MAG: hypothetical protein N2442_07285 [Spirochaetes bacterium]|nr:hypothetical protein [Spirochaetota bacterium]
MDPGSTLIRIPYTDPSINTLLANLPDGSPCTYTRHFNHLEEFFLKLDSSFIVPSCSIHHDVRCLEPDSFYLQNLYNLLQRLGNLLPYFFRGLTYGFDSAEVLRPLFYQIYTWEGESFLYLVRLDLSARLQEVEVLQKGTNDATPQYRSNRLYLEADLLPLEKIEKDSRGNPCFRIKQLISHTWIGEEGRGYFVQGIWIDRDLSKFFTKLFLPPGSRLYPYYPYNSRYRTLCLSLVFPEEPRRTTFVPLLYRGIHFLSPYILRIEETLKKTAFSENLELYQHLKASIPVSWYKEWDALQVRPYINEFDMKEYVLEEHP